MTEKVNNPQAFPVSGIKREMDYNSSTVMDKPYIQNGMTLRDYFAIHAPTDELPIKDTIDFCASYIGIEREKYNVIMDYRKVVAKARYEFADAMLAERSRTTGEQI